MSELSLNNFRPKAAIGVSTMARAIGMSRTSFYVYVRRGFFPQPMYSLLTRRPFYLPEQQLEIVQSRTTGIGLNGEYVLFYEQRIIKPKTGKPILVPDELLAGLKSLGLSATHGQAQKAIQVCFPNGISGIDENTLLAAVYRQIRRSDGV